MFTRRMFLKVFGVLAGWMTFGTVKASQRDQRLPKIKFARFDKNHVTIANGPEIMGDIPFERVPNMCPWWDGLVFWWERKCHAWVDKEDAFRQDGIHWGEVILTENVKYSAGGDSESIAYVQFNIDICERTKRIKIPQIMSYLTDCDEVIRGEVERAFADSDDQRPGLPVLNGISR